MPDFFLFVHICLSSVSLFNTPYFSPFYSLRGIPGLSGWTSHINTYCSLSLLIAISFSIPLTASSPSSALFLSSPSQLSFPSCRNVLLRRALELHRAGLDKWLQGKLLSGKTWGRWWGGRRSAPFPHRCLAGPPFLRPHHAGWTGGQLSSYLCNFQTQADEDGNQLLHRWVRVKTAICKFVCERDTVTEQVQKHVHTQAIL